MFDPLPPDFARAIGAAEARLGNFADVRFLAETDSTNDIAQSLVLTGAREGTAVLADLQRAGRGRRGREWISPAGAGLYLSVIMRPQERPSGLPMLTLGAGVALARAIRAMTGLDVELKWPNDIVIGRPWRKMGGVLCETAGSGSHVEAVVVGIGLNVAQVRLPTDLSSSATSLEAELGKRVDRPAILVAILAELKQVFAAVHGGRIAAIRQEWLAFGAAAMSGAFVRWRAASGEKRARVRDIGEDGALLVESGDGVERIVAGDVTWESLTT